MTSDSAVDWPTTTAFTIVTRSHFHYAVALSENLRNMDPSANLIIIVADLTRVGPVNSEQATVDWSWLHPQHQSWSECLGSFNDQRMILSGESVCDQSFATFAFQYTAFELTCALKSQAGCYLLQNGSENVVYLDADVRLFSKLDSILDELPNGGLLLTPHVRSRLPEDGKYPNNIDLLRTGNFNAGIWAYRSSHATRDELTNLLQWWRDCCQRQCIVDPHDGLFVDQKWLDQAVSISSAAVVSRNHGLNVGYWNLHEYDIESRFDELVAYHFSGVPTEDRRLSTHQNRHKPTRGGRLEQILTDYVAELQIQQQSHYDSINYNFATLDDGTEIAPSWREAIRTESPARQCNPFAEFATPSGHAVLTDMSQNMVAGRFDWQQAQLHNRIQTLRQKLDRQPLRWIAKTIKRKWKRA